MRPSRPTTISSDCSMLSTSIGLRQRSTKNLLLLGGLDVAGRDRLLDLLDDLRPVLVFALVGEHGVQVVPVLDETADELPGRAAELVVARPGRRGERADDEVGRVALGLADELLLDDLALLVSPAVPVLCSLGVEEADPVVGLDGRDLVLLLVETVERPLRDRELAFGRRQQPGLELGDELALDRADDAVRVRLVLAGPTECPGPAVLRDDSHQCSLSETGALRAVALTSAPVSLCLRRDRAEDPRVGPLVSDLPGGLADVLRCVGVATLRLLLGEQLRVAVAQRPALDVVEVDEEGVRAEALVRHRELAVLRLDDHRDAVAIRAGDERVDVDTVDVARRRVPLRAHTRAVP